MLTCWLQAINQFAADARDAGCSHARPAYFQADARDADLLLKGRSNLQLMLAMVFLHVSMTRLVPS